MKIVAFGASNSTKSINQQLAVWGASKTNADVLAINLNDFEMPIYSMDREMASGIPQEATKFKSILGDADGIIISFAEHNGSYSSAFKNIMDWASRIEGKLWLNKPMFLLATSPGPRGAKGVLDTATMSFPHQGAQVVAHFSLPSFYQNFDAQSGIKDEKIISTFNQELKKFTQLLDETTGKETTATA